MICPFCSHSRTNVTNSRPRKKNPSVWRRRECTHCERIFSTTESISLQDDIRIRSRNAITATPYNRGILLLSIADCFAHDVPRGHKTAWWLTETIEGALLTIEATEGLRSSQNEVTIDSSVVALRSYQVLRRYDQSAAIQYAAKHRLL